MADRAQYLARTLVARLNNLQSALAEDGQPAPNRQQRIATIEKVLAVELGVTDSSVLALVEAAAPQGSPSQRPSDRELSRFADFLREKLAAQLAEA